MCVVQVLFAAAPCHWIVGALVDLEIKIRMVACVLLPAEHTC